MQKYHYVDDSYFSKINCDKHIPKIELKNPRDI